MSSAEVTNKPARPGSTSATEVSTKQPNTEDGKGK